MGISSIAAALAAARGTRGKNKTAARAAQLALPSPLLQAVLAAEWERADIVGYHHKVGLVVLLTPAGHKVYAYKMDGGLGYQGWMPQNAAQLRTFEGSPTTKDHVVNLIG